MIVFSLCVSLFIFKTTKKIAVRLENDSLLVIFALKTSMGNKTSITLTLFMVVFFFVGCGRSGTQHGAGNDTISLSTIVHQADSLIDIAPDSTLVLCKEYFKRGHRDDSLYAKAKLIEGNAYFSMGDMDEAIKSTSEAKDLAQQSMDEYTLINAISDLGVMMRVSQKSDTALILYNEALSMIKGDNYKDEKAHLLTSIAILYANTGHLNEARDYADRAVEAARKSKDVDMIMYATSQAGAIYNLLGNGGKALQLVHEAINDARRQSLPRYEMKAIGHMIDIQLKAGNNDSVDYYLRRGDQLAKKFPETSAEGLGFLEEKYVALSAMKRYRESLSIQKRLLRLQAKAPTFMPAEKLWLRMARNYRGLSMLDSMAICYERSAELSDSLRGTDTDRQLSEFYARFKTTEKELALANAQREKARSDMWLAIALGIVLLLVAILVVGVLYLRARRRNERIRLLQSQLRGVEKERGRLAMDLHDGICNDLYGIEMLLQTGTGRDELLDNVERIRSDVRRISHEMMPPELQNVGLAQAIEAMTTQMAKANTDMSITFKSDSDGDSIPTDIAYQVYRICQELLGNMVRHAHYKSISISMKLEDQLLTLTISHDRSSTTPAAKGSDGIGLKSINERLLVIGATAVGLPSSEKITIRCRVDEHGSKS